MKNFKYLGVDLSKHNRVLSWDSVYNDNKVDFVILRAGGHFDVFYKDSRFEQYYNACKNYGIPVGAYYDCGKNFRGADFGKACAKHFISLIKDKEFEMPVFMDIEVTPREYKTEITEATVSFCTYMESKKYFTGIYASDISGYKERLDYSKVQAFTRWCARYGKEPEFCKSYNIWQYSSTGNINGIQGCVDLDATNVNYPFIIKRGHFNGY